MGKAHLLAHFLAHGAVSDAQIVTTSCFKSKQEEYLYPWQAVMLSIASYIRKEDIPIPTAYRQAVSALFPVFGSGEGSVEKKAHMLIDSVMSFDSVLMILSLAAEKRPLLLVLEDIQWMDKISADLLDQLLHKADSSRILFAATCRQPSGPVATPLLRGLEEDGLCRCCHLSPFTKDETMEFIQLYGAQSLPQADKERIYQDTQGNAFLLTQLIGSIMENGRPTVLPRNMEEILSYRLSGLTDEGLQVLNLVAMFPDRAPYPVLERVSSKPTLDLLYVCQELCRRSILTEVYDGGALSLAFAQAEFRELTYSRIPALSRRILHLNIAQAQAALAQADYAAARQALAQADRATGYLKEPSGYFQTLFCVYSALFAFADGDAQGCVSYLTQCQQLTDLLIVPCDTGILYLVKGLLRRLCDRMDQPPAPLDRYLDQSCESYCAQSRSALKGKAGVFELELLHRLDLGSADPLPGLLQVTEN